MKEYEQISVFAKIENGQTVCVCPFGAKRCRGNCQQTTVYRDRFKGWRGTMKRDKSGKR